MRWRAHDSMRRGRGIDDCVGLNLCVSSAIGYRTGLALQQHQNQSLENLN
jgi:hypothetical protein